MSKFLSLDRYTAAAGKSSLITAAGVVIFLAAGIFTMLFFPEQSERPQAAQPKISSLNFVPRSADLETKIDESDAAATPKPDWYVYVTGEVKNPGYYKVSADSRIFQAVEAAGGFTKKADQASVNMASFLTDGYQINVLAKDAKKNKNTAAPARLSVPGMMQAKPANPIIIHQQTRTLVEADGRININSASAKELEQLKGVGPVLAKRIIEYRNNHGNFLNIEDLLKVKGIGKAKLENMRQQLLIR